MSKKDLICYGVVGAIGLILIIVSMAGFAYFPPLIENQVFDNLDITNHESEGYKNFVSRNKIIVQGMYILLNYPYR